MNYVAVLVALVVGIGGGYWLGKPPEQVPVLAPEGDKGGYIATLPSGVYTALDMAGEYCKRWSADPGNPNSRARKYPVITDTAVKLGGGLRFDCIAHQELTGPFAR